MKAIFIAALSVGLFNSPVAFAHTWKAGASTDNESLREHLLQEWMQQHGKSAQGEVKPVQVASATSMWNLAAATAANADLIEQF